MLLALILAAINQIFSLLDPLVFKPMVDNNAIGLHRNNKIEFIQGVGGLILLWMGAAMMSRIAKNFQDYYVNVIRQKLGKQIYFDGLNH